MGELEKLLGQVLEAVRRLDIPHAVGGALAMAAHGYVRATRDIDLTLFASAESLGRVLEALRPIGLEDDIRAAVERARERGDCRVQIRGIYVDFFLPAIPFYESVEGRIEQTTVLEPPCHVLSAEDLVVFKLLFDRTKDRADLERLVALLGDRLDTTYVRGHLVEMVGEADGRVEFLDRLIGST